MRRDFLIDQRIVGSRLQNIYDLDSRTFIFKFAKPASPKALLLVESGTRLHETWHDREDPNVQPSFFTMRLRKWLRERRVTAMGQAGWDRVAWFEFGHDSRPELVFRLWVELYALGNVVLTGQGDQILLLLRTVNAKNSESGETIFQLAQGMVYPQPTMEFGLEKSLDGIFFQEKSSQQSVKNVFKQKFPQFSPAMLQHCLVVANVDPNQKCSLFDQWENVEKSIRELIHQIVTLQSFKGYIVKESVQGKSIFLEYHPIRFAQLSEQSINEFSSFNQAVDEFYAEQAGQMAEQRQKQQESEIYQRLTTVQREQESRITALEAEIERCKASARMIEGEAEKVQIAIAVVQTALHNGMSWTDLAILIEEEKRLARRPAAKYIGKLMLERNRIEVCLDEGSVEVSIVPLSSSGSASAALTNASEYYRTASALQAKLDRTREAMSQALRSAEARIRTTVKASRVKHSRAQLAAKRRSLWFERFNWFVSSDGYLVLAGRDQQQNEVLVKRHLRSGDAYVHADMHGAASVVVKNHRKGDSQGDSVASYPIPIRTLTEAGNMSLVHSKAWTAKIVTSAWWVEAGQVSKTAPTGEYLGTGSFMIRGRKNHLPPSQLTYSFGIMYLLDEETRLARRAARLERESIESANSEKSLIVTKNQGSDEEELEKQFEKYLGLIEEEDNNPDQLSQAEIEEKEEDKDKMRSNSQKSTPEKAKPQSKSKQETQEKPSQRGKKGKAKKMAKKYAHQDEEEREERLALLGSRGDDKKKKSVEVVVKKQPKPAEVSKPKLLVKAENAPNIQPLDDIEDPLEDNLNTNAGIDELAILDALTGNPSLADLPHIVQAIPVCGPVTSQAKFQLHLKLLPGSMKRGKAGQQAIHHILLNQIGRLTWSTQTSDEDKQIEDPSSSVEDQTALMRSKMRQLIKIIPEMEVTAAILPNVRISVTQAELAKVQKADRKERKVSTLKEVGKGRKNNKQ